MRDVNVTRAKALWEADVTVKDICDTLGIHPRTFLRVRNDMPLVFPVREKKMSREDILEAARMWKDGKTGPDIRRRFGISKGTVSGMMGRDRVLFPERFGDLMKKNKSAKSLPPKPKVEKRVNLSANKLRQIFNEAFGKPTAPKPKEQHLAYDASRLPGVTMMDLDERRCCRWPLLDTVKGEVQYFCGEAKSGKNYCAAHSSRSVRTVA